MNTFLILSFGFIVGVVFTGSYIFYLMREKMVVSYRSKKDFEETCKAVEDVVAEFKEEGWGFPIPKWHFWDTFMKKNLKPKNFKNIMVYFVCNASLADKVISEDSKMVGIMPCTWAVYQLEDGSVYVAKMNVGLMAKMFSGTIKETMLKVEDADKRMLEKVLN